MKQCSLQRKVSVFKTFYELSQSSKGILTVLPEVVRQSDDSVIIEMQHANKREIFNVAFAKIAIYIKFISDNERSQILNLKTMRCVIVTIPFCTFRNIYN